MDPAATVLGTLPLYTHLSLVFKGVHASSTFPSNAPLTFVGCGFHYKLAIFHPYVLMPSNPGVDGCTLVLRLKGYSIDTLPALMVPLVLLMVLLAP